VAVAVAATDVIMDIRFSTLQVLVVVVVVVLN
jgi:hypothetical protein